MPLVLDIIFAESAPASRRPLGQAESLTLGRSLGASISFPTDVYLSSLHCSIEGGLDTCLVRDLNSTNGTFVDGLRIKEAVVRAGQMIAAGSVTIFPVPSEDSAQSSWVHPLLRHFNSLDAPLFCLLDAACSPEILNLIRDAKEPGRCLYDGKSAQELEAYAPYLIQLPPGSGLLKTLLIKGWRKGWAAYFTSRSTFDELRHHFRKFLFVKIDDGAEVYFRFYDPRVLRTFLPTCNDAELAEFFGPVDTWVLEFNALIQLVALSQKHGVLNTACKSLSPFVNVGPQAVITRVE